MVRGGRGDSFFDLVASVFTSNSTKSLIIRDAEKIFNGNCFGIRKLGNNR